MVRHKGLVLALGLVLTSVAMPAVAASIASCRSETIEFADGRKYSKIQLQADLYVAQLRRMGYDLDSVEDWQGCVKASVREPGGHTHFMFFDPDTLEPLTTN